MYLNFIYVSLTKPSDTNAKTKASKKHVARERDKRRALENAYIFQIFQIPRSVVNTFWLVKGPD